MKHINRFNENNEEVFNVRELVVYGNRRARIRSRNGNKYTIMVMPDGNGGGKEIIDDVDISELRPIPRCLGRCDKQVVDIPTKYGGGKGIYCFGCDRALNRL